MMAAYLSHRILILIVVILFSVTINGSRQPNESSSEESNEESSEESASRERSILNDFVTNQENVPTAASAKDLSGLPLRRRRDTSILLDEPEYVYARAEVLPNPALPRDQRKARGTVFIRQRKSSQGIYRETEFKVSLQGLSPSSLHGFHVHEYGTIGASCTQSGSHYNPFGRDHGAPATDERHVGDLGNVRTDENGNVDLEFSDLKAKLYTLTTIVGRAFVVHAGMDDLGVHEDKGSKTTGNAGGRAACGVIVWSDGAGWRGPQP